MPDEVKVIGKLVGILRQKDLDAEGNPVGRYLIDMRYYICRACIGKRIIEFRFQRQSIRPFEHVEKEQPHLIGGGVCRVKKNRVVSVTAPKPDEIPFITN